MFETLWFRDLWVASEHSYLIVGCLPVFVAIKRQNELKLETEGAVIREKKMRKKITINNFPQKSGLTRDDFMAFLFFFPPQVFL